jgi:thioredoxin 1
MGAGIDRHRRDTLGDAESEIGKTDERGTFMAGKNLVEITDGEFEQEILKSDIPALVDFWAPWCGPCRTIAPAVESVAEKFSGKLKVAKMNVDDNRSTPGNYGIMSIPTLILFKNGEVVDRITGAVPQSRLEEAVEKALEA